MWSLLRDPVATRERVSVRQHGADGALEATDEPVERIAELAGFGSPANLRQHFSRATGVSPLSYRRTFRHRGTAA